jgi:transcriptional regulator with GAF, ATPase, and Fis domain
MSINKEIDKSEKGLIGKFNIIAFVVAAIPVIAAVYIIQETKLVLYGTHILVLTLALVFIVAGLMSLRRIFVNIFKNLLTRSKKFAAELEQCTTELNAIAEMTEAAKQDPPVDGLLELLLDKAMQVTAVRNGSVFLVDPVEPEGLRFVAAKPKTNIEKTDGKPRRHSFVRSVIESGKALIIQDIERDPRTMKSNNPKYGAPSFISMPIYKHKQVIAVLNLANKENGGLFTDTDERILSIMLSETGFALENIILRQEIKNQSAEIRELNSKINHLAVSCRGMN